MSVKLRKRSNSDGSTTLFLDIHHNGKRFYDFLGGLKLLKESNVADRSRNKENLALAKMIVHQKTQELVAVDYNIDTKKGSKLDVVEWLKSYEVEYRKKDKRMMKGTINRFETFLKLRKIEGLIFRNLSETLISDFQDYLQEHGTGEGASSYFKRFKRMIKQAYRQGVITINPAAEVKTVTGKSQRKDILTLEEITILNNTHTESAEVKKAFLFSCMTGLRWVDISNLKWSNVDLRNSRLVVQQAKTGVSISMSLNETAIKLLPEPKAPGEKVFILPSADGANKTVKAWVKRAGIQKKITWHNARHSFGTNLIYYGADVTTASTLLGHSSLKHTVRYIASSEELKNKATDALNFKLD